ncbi:hypothetical protein M2128_000091 [Polynucleobacter sphagniphilus]|jgi:hypothetical protein|uniref:hypothetical protein n=1 Tax=Polynucleobacter sphagniphilus TaxID=1743169 RepID=UPI0024769679|nr:hypothetical protein [Polynucleobacter sphagniphilus]MDH6301189.1 hypothetical protein [Polynucleobacter sphagniphilus]
MPSKPSKTIDEQFFEARIKVIEAKEDFETQLYFETMPTIDPLYKYCYATSNWNIPAEHQSVDAWLRAVKKHMNTRLPSHGGETSNSLVVSAYKELGSYEDLWVEYVTQKLKKLTKSRTKKAK